MSESKTSGVITAYHGSDFDNISGLNADFMGTGNDSYGPGMYWSNSIDLARGYGKFIYTAELNLKRIVPINRRLTSMQIQSFIIQAPDYEDTLTNFGEKPATAMRLAVQAMSDSGDNAAEQLQSIWWDFYRDSVPEYVRMVAKSFDAAIIPVQNDLTYYIVFNPASVRIINIESQEENYSKSLKNKYNTLSL